MENTNINFVFGMRQEQHNFVRTMAFNRKITMAEVCRQALDKLMEDS